MGGVRQKVCDPRLYIYISMHVHGYVNAYIRAKIMVIDCAHHSGGITAVEGGGSLIARATSDDLELYNIGNFASHHIK